jgi:phage shock protein E
MFGLFKNRKSDRIQKYLQQGATLLDVRTSSEFNGSHIEGSINIPVQSIDQHIEKLDKSKPVITYCALGGRSAMAAAKLKSQGFKVVSAGGINTVRKQLKKH